MSRPSEGEEDAPRRRAMDAPTPEELARLKERVPDPRQREALERDLEDVSRSSQWAW